MGLKDLFRKKQPSKAVEQPVRVSDGGSFLIRTGDGRTCLFLLPVWKSDPADESISLFLEAGGTIEYVVVLNINENGWLHSLNYLSHLPDDQNYTLYVANPSKSWFRYPEGYPTEEAENLFEVKPLPAFAKMGALEVHFPNPSAKFVTCVYDNPAKGGKDVLLLGLEINPDISLIKSYQRQGLNVNVFGTVSESALTENMGNLTEWLWETCKGQITFLFPNAVKGVQGTLLTEMYKAGGLTAAAVGTQENLE